MAKNPKIPWLQKVSAHFCNVRDVDDLARLMDMEEYRLHLLALKPQYNVFSIPKKNGEKRLIEDPDDDLQSAQSKLNYFLQSVYYFIKTPAAYGFVTVAKNDPDPRNILTNAQRHLGSSYMFNADLKDFFHQVTFEKVCTLLKKPVFNLMDDAVEIISKITTFKGRLPMGAPTSPVLSNFATIDLDKKLLELSQWANWTFTRYADDFTFSSPSPFSETDIAKIIQITASEGFEFNPKKFKTYAPQQQKIVTGLVLKENTVALPDEFLPQLLKELDRLKGLTEAAHQAGRKEKWIQKYREQIEGKVAFAQFVLGDKSTVTHDLEQKLFDATHPPDDFGAMSWLDFGYL